MMSHSPHPGNRHVVEEIIVPYRGVRRFEITDSRGEWLRTVEMPELMATQQAIDELWDYLEDVDPQPTLTLHSGGR